MPSPHRVGGALRNTVHRRTSSPLHRGTCLACLINRLVDARERPDVVLPPTKSGGADRFDGLRVPGAVSLKAFQTVSPRMWVNSGLACLEELCQYGHSEKVRTHERKEGLISRPHPVGRCRCLSSRCFLRGVGIFRQPRSAGARYRHCSAGAGVDHTGIVPRGPCGPLLLARGRR